MKEQLREINERLKQVTNPIFNEIQLGDLKITSTVHDLPEILSMMEVVLKRKPVRKHLDISFQKSLIRGVG